MSQLSSAIETFVDASFGENAFVVSTTNEACQPVALVIDPSFPPQVNELIAYIADQRIKVEGIVLTHGHADHIAGLDQVHAAHPEAAILLAEADQPMLGDPGRNLSAPFGMALTMQARATGDLVPGTDLALGSLVFKVLDTSGHSPGGRSLYCADISTVFTGDALFAGSIGRTDFPDSDPNHLIHNIRDHLLSLPDDTTVCSGHGPTTSIGNERKFNPFLSD